MCTDKQCCHVVHVNILSCLHLLVKIEHCFLFIFLALPGGMGNFYDMYMTVHKAPDPLKKAFIITQKKKKIFMTASKKKKKNQKKNNNNNNN